MDRSPTRFVVTIDTEEEGLWSGEYAPTGTVENIRGVPRFQELCDKHAVRPTYLVDAPVVLSASAVGTLKPIQDDNRAEIGAHVHPWNTPPLEEERIKRNSYLCNLPEELQRAKIEWLTDTIESKFGRRPKSFRAGRYGLDIVGARILAECGYLVDSSVIPLTDYRSQGGPDFREARMTPYFVGDEDLRKPADRGGLFEVPVTVGYTHRHFEFASRARATAHRTLLRRMKMVGILDRLGIATRVKLSPEQANLKQLRQLAIACHARSHPILVLMFHSSSLVPGLSPYVKDLAELDQFLNRLDKFFSFLRDDLRANNCTLAECYPT